MQHDEIKELLSPYFDGELSSEESSTVKAHLETGAECRGEWEAWSNTKRLLFPMKKEFNVEAFVQKVMDKIPGPKRNVVFPGFGSWWRAPAFAFAALVIVFLKVPSTDIPLSTNNLLLSGNVDEQGQSIWQQDRVENEDLVNLFWGED